MSFITDTPNPDLFDNLSGKALKDVTQMGELLETQIAERQLAENDEDNSKQGLKDIVKQAYFEYNDAATTNGEVPVHTFDFGNLQVNFLNSYVLDEDSFAELSEAIGEDQELIEELEISTSVFIDTTELELEGTATEYYRKLLELNEQYGVIAEVDDHYSVSEDFHNKRHELFDAEDNEVIDEILPVVVQFNLINS